MKQPLFRLQSILEYRKFLKSQASGRLAEATRKRALAFDALARVNALLDRYEKEFKRSSGSRLPASQFMIMQEGLASQRGEVRKILQRYEAALAEEIECRGKLVQLQKEYESVLKLQEKHLEQSRAAMLRNEEIALSEFTTARFKKSVI